MTVKDQTALQAPDPSSPPICNILIVDDEPSNLLALEAILEPLRQNVVRASSGIEALKHALKTEFCVILLDVQMPEMDGLETAALLRKRPRTRDVPIIFLTAISKDRSWVARGYEAGGVDYIVKPYDPEALRTKVGTFVELAKKNAIIRAQHEALRVGSQRELAAFKRWSEQRYVDLADSMPQVVWTADASGTITYHNQRWSELTGSIAAPMGSTSELTAIAHPSDVETLLPGWSAAVAAGLEWEAEIRLGSRTKGYRYHLVRAVPRRDEKGELVAWVGTATDIDARVRAERALRILADASHRLNGSLEEPKQLEAVLRSALAVLGDAAILDLEDDAITRVVSNAGRQGDDAVGPSSARDRGPPSNAGGQASERLCVVRPGVDAARLADPRFDLGPATVLYSGRAEVFLDIEHEAAALGARDPDSKPSGRGAEHLRFLRELGVGAYICVPLVSRGRAIGTLSFIRFGAGEHFEDADAELAGDLARRIAVSIDNARLHQTTERRREELEQANRSKDVFLATLSHELRTPLNAIVGWTDMMKKGSLSGEDLARALETIDRNAQALSGLVGDLLDVSRIVTGTLKLEAKLVSLASIVEAAVLAARPQCAARGIVLELDADEKTAAVLGDAGRLRQVIANLLSNAIKFTPSGGTVSVRVAPADVGRVRVVVQDSGQGIAPEFLPHVFERFRQEETGRAKGLGLGLAIVKHLVEEHGGTVGAASDGRGKGATFFVELPVASGEAQESDRGASMEAGEPDLTGVHVLLVEDDPDGNELVCTILERYGARVTSVTTATAALHALDSDERPHVIVSDIGLPDMDGMHLIKVVRDTEAIASMPAVALTAYASRQDATKAIAAGFDAHVAKPVQPATLGDALLRLLMRGAPGEESAASGPAV